MEFLIIFSWCCFAVSAAILLAGLAVSLFSRHKRMRRNERAGEQRRRVFSPFQIFLGFFFPSAAVLFLPVYLSEAGEGVSHAVRSVLLSIHNAMRLFILDGDFSGVQGVFGQAGIPDGLEAVYTVYAALLFVAAPILTAGFVLSFFRNVGSVLRYVFSRPKHLVYMSELNERSLALAENILKEEKKGTQVIFCDVFVKNEETEYELLEEASRLGAICFRKDVSQIFLRRSLRDARRTFYLIGADEDENVKQALSLLGHCGAVTLYNTPKTEFFVFSTTPASAPLLDSVEHGNMKVRRVNEARSLAWNTVREQGVFEKYRTENGEKTVSVLIVGSGGYGTELAKTVLWCGQLPGYRVKVHVVDCKEDVKARFESHSPSLVAESGLKRENYPRYDLHFYGKMDVNTSDFDRLLGEIGPFTSVFVTLGDDDKNVSVAMKIDREIRRRHGKAGACTVYAVVYSSLKLAALEQSGRGLGCLDIDSYDVAFIGDINSCYSPKVIEQKALDDRGREVHNGWATQKNADKQRQDLATLGAEGAVTKARDREARYEKYEYYRDASMATALYEEVVAALGLSLEDFGEKGKEKYEHLRWYAYMCAEGFSPGEEIDVIAKVHSAMREYRGSEKK